MFRVHWLLAVGVLVGTVSCSNKEQVYEGLYQGFSSVEDTRMTEDAAYDSVQAQERKKQSYQEYKREREQLLKE